MECPSNLERPNLLEVLGLEEQPDLRPCRRSTLPCRSLQRLSALRCGCEVGERGVGEHRRGVDVGFDQAVSSANGVARQGDVN